MPTERQFELLRLYPNARSVAESILKCAEHMRQTTDGKELYTVPGLLKRAAKQATDAKDWLEIERSEPVPGESRSKLRSKS